MNSCPIQKLPSQKPLRVYSHSVYTCAIVVILLFCSCLRYVPPYKELETSDQEIALVSDRKLIEKVNSTQQDRLKKLLEERTIESNSPGVSAYYIGPGDLLDLSVPDLEELNIKLRVPPDGYLALPILGQIEVVGKTEASLQNEIQLRLKKYLRTPQVRLSVAEHAAHMVSVLGEVNKPGIYPLKRSKMTLLEILAEAGGKGENTGGFLVFIPSSSIESAAEQVAVAALPSVDSPESRGIEIYFDQLSGSLYSDPLQLYLQGGDTIIVPEAGFVDVDGEVVKPGSYRLGSRMTLLGALAAAGGMTYSANVHEIELIRELGFGKKALHLVDVEELTLRKAQDIRLRNGDVVRIPSQRGRFVTRQIVDMFNSLLNFGFNSKPL